MPIEEGKAAPAFKLKDQDGNVVSLADFKGKQNVVLYFYPKDDTPGCTKQACSLRDASLAAPAMTACSRAPSTASGRSSAAAGRPR